MFGLKHARFAILRILNFQLAENIFCNYCFDDKQQGKQFEYCADIDAVGNEA